MLSCKRVILPVLLFLFLSGTLVFANNDFKIGLINLTDKNWGTGFAEFRLEYTGYEYKFIAATAVVEFTEGPYRPARYFKKNYIMEPESAVDVTLPVIIPASYGKGIINISLYDVVDTLDQPFESQRFFEKKIPFEFSAPSELTGVVNLEIALPVLMEQNALFDNALTRLVPVLMSRGKTSEEIAQLCHTTPEIINGVIEALAEKRFIIKAGEKIRPGFIVIDEGMINRLKPSIDSTIDEIYGAIKANLPAYNSLLAEMIAGGDVTPDPNDVLSGSSVLHHKYPLIMTFLMWNVLGRSFISDGAPFDIFPGSDPCNGKMAEYFYMVPAGDDYVGKSFYYQTRAFGQEAAYCGYGEFEIVCEPGYEQKAANNLPVRWFFARESMEVAYMFETSKLIKPVSVLMENSTDPMSALRANIDKTMKGYMYDLYGKGVRYWCWNLVVTGVMDKLTENGDIKKEDSGLYTFQRMDM